MIKSSFLVYIAGNIGAGKSTVVDFASRQRGWQGILEEQEEFLRHALEHAPSKFHSQVYFSMRRLEQNNIIRDHVVSVVERSIEEDRYVFWNYYKNKNLLSDEDIQALYYMYTIIKPNFRTPDLIIFLSVPTDIIRTRIEMRNRSFEQDFDLSLLEQLENSYKNTITEEGVVQLITVDGDRDPLSVWKDVRNTINHALKSRGH